MLTLERQNTILEILRKDKAATIQELAEKFNVSTASVRRDLEKLEKQGFAVRTYGGAVSSEGINIEIPVEVREIEQKEAKVKIARAASQFITENDAIFMDASTTVKELTSFLGNFSGLTVVTNGIRAMSDLAAFENINVYGISGQLRKHSLSLVGNQAEDCVACYWVTKMFFSCTGLLLQCGAMDYSDAEAAVRQRMMENSQTVILMADHTKFDRPAFFKVCPFSRVNILITDRKLNSEWESVLQQNNVEIIYSE